MDCARRHTPFLLRSHRILIYSLRPLLSAQRSLICYASCVARFCWCPYLCIFLGCLGRSRRESGSFVRWDRSPMVVHKQKVYDKGNGRTLNSCVVYQNCNDGLACILIRATYVQLEFSSSFLCHSFFIRFHFCIVWILMLVSRCCCVCSLSVLPN